MLKPGPQSRVKPRPPLLIHLRASDRSCLFGRTGSGKTTQGRRLLTRASAESRWVVLDPKWDFGYPDPAVPVVPEYRPKLDRQIVRVPPDAYEQQRWDACIDDAWRQGDTLIYVDELTLLTPRTYLRPSLGKAIRTGRSRGVGVWCASQRPKDLPSAVFTESEHFFLFRLTFAADREKVLSFTTERLRAPLERLVNHDFVYYSVLDDRAYLVKG